MDTSDYIALASAVTALSALGVSVWQGYIAREHNKRSVLPILYIDKEMREGSDIELTALNHGVGPAIIKSFSIYCDDTEHEFPSKSDYAAILVSLGLNPAENSFTADVPLQDNVLKSDGSFSIIKFVGSGQKPELHKQIMNVLPRLKIKVVYESIYSESKTIEYS
ncbi:MAG: hypothetical protein ACRER2_16715, partial [Methylococcales bacterium]